MTGFVKRSYACKKVTKFQVITNYKVDRPKNLFIVLVHPVTNVLHQTRSQNAKYVPLLLTLSSPNYTNKAQNDAIPLIISISGFSTSSNHLGLAGDNIWKEDMLTIKTTYIHLVPPKKVEGLLKISNYHQWISARAPVHQLGARSCVVKFT